MKRSLLTLVGALCVASFANAGHFTVRSNSLISYDDASSYTWTDQIPTSSKTLGGYGTSLVMDVTPTHIPGHNISGGAQTEVVFQMEVVWHPDPGDPATPATWDSYWDITQSATCKLQGGALAVPPNFTVSISGQMTPDPNSFNFNQNFGSTTNINHGSTTANNYQYGAFSFHADGSDWVGVATFTINIQMSGTGTVPSGQNAGVLAHLTEDWVLDNINGYPVI